MKFQAIIFDFDGTLVDTFPGILRSWQMTFEALGLGPVDPERVRASIGPTKDVYLKMMLGDLAPTHGEKALEMYKRFYKQESPARTFVYDGVYELLEILAKKKVPMAIASNKPFRQITLLAEKFGFTPRFRLIMGPEITGKGKPDPDMFLRCAAHTGVAPENTLVVGDTELDMIAAQRAGMKRAAALWGYSSREHLAGFSPEYFAERPLDVAGIMESK
jgi:phosphoglycolate phosphatase